MKTIGLALIAFIMFGALASTAYGQNLNTDQSEEAVQKAVSKAVWEEHSKSAESFFLDKGKGSTQREGDIVIFLVKSNKRGTVVYYLYAGNCVQDTLAYVGLYSVKSNGKLKRYDNEAITVDEVKAGQVGWSWLNYVCSN